MKLTRPQHRLLAELVDGRVHRYNGTVRQPIEALRVAGLIVADYDLRGVGTGQKVSEIWSVQITDAGRREIAGR